MPRRIIREEILTSDPVNSLSWGAEVFYRRLMSKVDDYGRYVADLRILRATLYPLQLHKVVNSDIGKWLSNATHAGLVSVYEVDGKSYLEVRKFDQRLRQKTSIYPPPPDGCPSDDGHMTASGGDLLTYDSNGPPEVEEEVEEERENPLTPLKGEVAAQAPQRAKSRAAPPNLEDLVSFCKELNLPRTDAEYYDDHWKANGYRIGSNPVRDWKAVIRNHKRHGWLPSQRSTNNPGRSPPKQARL